MRVFQACKNQIFNDLWLYKLKFGGKFEKLDMIVKPNDIDLNNNNIYIVIRKIMQNVFLIYVLHKFSQR